MLIVKMQPGELCFIVHTDPANYAGVVAICEIIEIQKYDIKIRFLNYLLNKISIKKMKRLSPECNTTDMLIKISEKSFCKIFEASNQTELIDE